MAYKVIILYRLYMPSYFLWTFTKYPQKEVSTIVFHLKEASFLLIQHFTSDKAF